MRILPIVLGVLIVSCTKYTDAPLSKDNARLSLNSVADQKPETCRFGLQVFNQIKRAPLPNDYSLKIKPRGQPEVTSRATILLDFDGHETRHALWNGGNVVHATPANLLPAEVEKILQRVSEDFAPFDVTITTDEALYARTNPYKRVRVIITENWEWFGVVGGTAYINSFVWGDDTPCFIFSTLLHYNEKFIAEAISHEAGHTLGLQHQAVYDGGCNMVSEYNEGYGEGPTGWAPIMGIGYYRNVTTWHKGPTSAGCGTVQDDVAVLSAVLDLRPDENKEMNRDKLTSSVEGVINTNNDIDYYYLDIKKPTTVVVHPKCLEQEEGANLKLKIHIYNKHRVFLKTISEPLSLSVRTVLNKEKYFIGVETEESKNQTRYGMLGRYTLSTE